MLTSLRSREAFERALKTAPLARSPHFSLHHWAGWAAESNLSTTPGQPRPRSVDNLAGEALLGLVIPKRLAARAVTRNALKRQARAAVQAQAPGLAHGAWVVRLKAPFDRKVFVSATSQALMTASRQELDGLLRAGQARARRPASGAARPPGPV